MGMVSRFGRRPTEWTLKHLHYDFPPDVYPVGRLDKDSEGLLLLTNDPEVPRRLLNPRFRHEREYWVQVEGRPVDDELEPLRRGIFLDGKPTLPAVVEPIEQPENLPSRVPPLPQWREAHSTWLRIVLTEGRNRQIRRMTAAVGFPTLRLIRVRIQGVVLKTFEPEFAMQIPRHIFYQALFEGRTFRV